MSKTLRWVFVLLPCTPGATLLLAGLAQAAAARDAYDAERVGPLYTAGGAVLLAGIVIGAFVAWRIAHPRPEPAEDAASGGHPPPGG